jgi:hypothetical protein
MHAAILLLRLNSRVMSAVMGGVAVFCLYHATQASDHDFIWYLLTEVVKWGGCATAIVYFQEKYLKR